MSMLVGLLVRQDPAAWLAGFQAAAGWVEHLAQPGQAEAIHQMIRRSLWPAVGWPPYLPWVEGFLLGVYGYMAAREGVP